MILLLGGTSDARPIAERLAQGGYRVLVSQATDVPLETGGHPNIESRFGLLDELDLGELIDRRGIRAIVDAAHPYAAAIHAAASRVARAKGIPYLRYVRPAAFDVKSADGDVEFAKDHAAAAVAAFRHGRPVLLTTGARNLTPYVEESRRSGLPLIVRVLDQLSSRNACLEAGIPSEHVITGRGPFSVEENRRHIRSFNIGALVTKDSGHSGGTPEKLEAARAESCKVVVVARPDLGDDKVFDDIEQLMKALVDTVV